MATINKTRTEITRFKVFSRVRPFIEEEMQYVKDGVFKSVVEMIDNRTILLDPETMNPTKNSFEFDKSLWSIPPTQKIQQIFADARRDTYDTQLDVYNLVAKGCVEDSFNGYNSCVLTYGQTGSGKTHTMMGKYDPKVVCGGDGEEGVIPRVCCDVFAELDRKRAAEKTKAEADQITYTVEVTFVEIYMEKVRDLLDPALERGKDIECSEARIRESPVSGPFVEGVKRYKVESWADCCKLLERGSRHRTTSATTVHNQSSRSHAIFQITVLQQTVVPPKDKYSPPGTKIQAARINLVDLAGSERGGFTDYVKESAKINKSLLALRRVIDNLVERQDILMELQRAELEAGESSANSPAAQAARNPPQVPYRDSVLTWLLSDSLGGNARTTMIATLSPLAKNYNDTLSTLVWSSKARKLVSVVHQNDPQSTMANKTSELQSNLLIRQQNMTDLRSTLEDQKKTTASLIEQTENIQKTSEKQWSDADEVRRIAQIIKCQAIFRRKLHKLRMKRLEADRIRYQAILDEALETKAEEDASLATKGDEEKARQQALVDCRASLAKTQEEIKRHKTNQAAFEEHRNKVTEEYETLKREIKDGESEYKAEIEQLTKANDQARATVTDSEKKISESAKKVEGLEAEIRELKTHDFDAEGAAIDAEIAKMKAELDALKTRKASVAAAHAEMMKVYRKTFPNEK